MKKILISFLAIFLCLISSAISYAEKISTDLKENIFRIHIIANSNNLEDQKLKLKIRDNILNYFSKQNLTFSNIEDCIEYYNNNIEKIAFLSLPTINVRIVYDFRTFLFCPFFQLFLISF